MENIDLETPPPPLTNGEDIPKLQQAPSISATQDVLFPLPMTPPPQLRNASNMSNHSSVGSRSVTMESLPDLKSDEEETQPDSCCVQLEKQNEKCLPYFAIASIMATVVLGMADLITDCLVLRDWVLTNRVDFAVILGVFIVTSNATNTMLLAKHGWKFVSLFGLIGMASWVEAFHLLKKFGWDVYKAESEQLAHYHLYRLVETSIESFPSAGIQIFILIVSHERSALLIVSTSMSILSLAVGLVRGVSDGPDHVSSRFDPLYQSMPNTVILALAVAGDFVLRVSSMSFFLQIVQWRPYVFLVLPLVFLFELLLHGIRLTVFDPDVLLGLHMTKRIVTAATAVIFSLLACFSGAPQCLVVVDPRQDRKLRRLFWIGLGVRDVLCGIFICCFMYFGPFNWLKKTTSDTIWFITLLVCAFIKWSGLVVLRFVRLRSHFVDLEKFRVDTLRQISPADLTIFMEP